MMHGVDAVSPRHLYNYQNCLKPGWKEWDFENRPSVVEFYDHEAIRVWLIYYKRLADIAPEAPLTPFKIFMKERYKKVKGTKDEIFSKMKQFWCDRVKLFDQLANYYHT